MSIFVAFLNAVTYLTKAVQVRKSLFWLTVKQCSPQGWKGVAMGMAVTMRAEIWGRWSCCLCAQGSWETWMHTWLVPSFPLPFYLAWNTSPWTWCCPHWGCVFPPQLNLHGNNLTWAEVCLLGDSKLTVKIKHHSSLVSSSNRMTGIHYSSRPKF